MLRRVVVVPWQCPRCRTKLPQYQPGSAWQCEGCHTQYYMVGDAPVLVSEPDDYLCKTLDALHAYCDQQEAYLDMVQAALDTEELQWRRPVFSQTQRGLEQLLQLAREQIAALQQLGASTSSEDGATPRDGRIRQAETDSYGLYNLTYLRMDWARTREGEQQIATVERAVLRQIETYCDAHGSAVVLGAGTGRHVFDLAGRFAQTIAIERCYSYVDLFARLQHAPLTFCEFAFGRPNSSDTLVAKYLASMPENRDILSRICYAIADARSLPLPDSSQSTVLSIYFADVIPLPELLTEVARVLKPGGRFINFGPLDYHFQNPTWMLAPDEIRSLVPQFGFAVEEETSFEMPYFRSPHDGAYVVYRVWSYVLTKNAPEGDIG